MTINLFWIWAVLGILNLRMFSLMFWDKWLAQQNANSKSKRKRIAERRLLWGAALFGSAGAILGMLAFRHKTRKNYFVFSFALFMILQMALLYVGKWYAEEELGWTLKL